MHHTLVHFAYVDPGSGTLALQMLIAGCAGAIVMFKSRIMALFNRKKERNDKAE